MDAETKATVDTLAARIAELEAQLEAAEKRKAKDAALLFQAREAMTWELGGEPLDTLMIKARNDIDAALEATTPENRNHAVMRAAYASMIAAAGKE